jgi:hypothetical protein
MPGMPGGGVDMSQLMQQYAGAGTPGTGGDVISQLMQFFGKQPQLIVCGQFGLKPLTDDQRRELLAGAAVCPNMQPTRTFHPIGPRRRQRGRSSRSARG